MNSDMTYEDYLEQVKTGITTESGECPVTTLLLMLQGKWKSQVLYTLGMHDSVRFGVLKKEVPGITNTMLAATLRDLESDGLIHREQFNEVPPHVEYFLSEKGHDLQPIFYQMMIWGFKHGQ